MYKLSLTTILLFISIQLNNIRQNAHIILSSNHLKLANIDCSDYDQNGVQHCVVGISSDNLTVVRQQNTEWCWAASISAIFSYYGHDVSQERIVAETFGTIANVPGQPSQIYRALNRTWTDDSGDDFVVNADVLSANAFTAIQDLTNAYPLIVGTLGHAMVLTSMEYNHDVYNHIAVTSAVVRDPWPYNANRRILSLTEFRNISFLARIRIN